MAVGGVPVIARGTARARSWPWVTLTAFVMLGAVTVAAQDRPTSHSNHATNAAPVPTPDARPPTSNTQNRPLREPTVDAVVTAALQALKAGLTDPADLSQRARLRGLVPRLSVSARRGQTVDLSQRQSLGTDALRLDTDNDLTLQASLVFDLPRLVFAREETIVARERRAQQQAAQKLTDHVIDLFFARKRVLARLTASLPAEERAALRLDLAALEARLQAVTAGRFRALLGQPRAH